jgi:retron-type reverse transcriptase
MGTIVNEIARPAALWAAWARVAAGSGMPGADGVSVTGFARRLGPRLTALSEQLRSGEYRAQPLRLVTGSRGGRPRERGVPTVADRVVQRAFLRVCEPRLVSRTDVTSFAYQRGRSWVDALRQARVHGDSGLRWVFRTDIADFFASVDHRLLLDRVASELTDPDVVALVRDWVRAPVLTDTGVRDRRAGIPEGSLCAAAHKPPYEQRRVMCSAGRHGLVTAGFGVQRCA